MPVPVSVVDTVTLLLFGPTVVPVTLTVTLQDELAANVPADKLTADDPATAVAVPPQVLLRAGVDATTRPAGMLSVKASPVNPTFEFEF